MGFGSITWQILEFRAKQWIKDIIKCCHWAKTTNIGLPDCHSAISESRPILFQYWRGIFPLTPPAKILGDLSPAGLMPVFLWLWTLDLIMCRPTAGWVLHAIAASARRVLNLPLQTQCYLIPLLCRCLPQFLMKSVEGHEFWSFLLVSCSLVLLDFMQGAEYCMAVNARLFHTVCAL